MDELDGDKRMRIEGYDVPAILGNIIEMRVFWQTVLRAVARFRAALAVVERETHPDTAESWGLTRWENIFGFEPVEGRQKNGLCLCGYYNSASRGLQEESGTSLFIFKASDFAASADSTSFVIRHSVYPISTHPYIYGGSEPDAFPSTARVDDSQVGKTTDYKFTLASVPEYLCFAAVTGDNPEGVSITVNGTQINLAVITDPAEISKAAFANTSSYATAERQTRLKIWMQQMKNYGFREIGDWLWYLLEDEIRTYGTGNTPISTFSMQRDGTPKVTVRVPLASEKNIDDIRRRLEKIVPLGTILDVSALYHTFAEYSGNTWDELSGHTFDDAKHGISAG